MRRKVFLTVSALIVSLRDKRILPQELERALFCLRDSKRIILRIISDLPQPTRRQLKEALIRAWRERRLLWNADSGALLNALVIAHTEEKISGIEGIHSALNAHASYVAQKAKESNVDIDLVAIPEYFPRRAA